MNLQEARRIMAAANPRDAVLRKAIKAVIEAYVDDLDPGDFDMDIDD